MMNEQWRPVPEFETLYEISSTGKIKNSKRGKLLKPRPNKDGYMRVALSKKGRYHHYVMHRLVATVFLGGPPDGKLLVLHNDGDPSNNEVSNLRWGTNSENMLDRIGHGTDRNALKTHCIHGHEFTESNTYLNKFGHRSCQNCRRGYTRISNQKKKNKRMGEKE